MAKTIDQLTALAATPDDSADTLLISDAGVTKKITAGNLKGDCIRAQKNNALDSSNGTKIGTNANQLLGFWNATPVDQPAVTADLLDSLQEVGLIASGAGATPLNLSAGALTCGPIAAGAGSVIGGNTSTDALRITQEGAGNALVVEDSANPDSTPLVINNVGQIISGATTAFHSTAGIQLASDSGNAPSSNMALRRHQGDTAEANSVVILGRSRGTAAAPQSTQSGDAIGGIAFQLYNGTSFANAAAINGRCDGTPNSDSPGALTFSTTPSGSTSIVERMRIDNVGNVGIGGTADADAILDLQSTTKGFLPPRMTGAQRDAISTPPAGLMVYNTTTNKLNFYNGSAWEAVTSS